MQNNQKPMSRATVVCIEHIIVVPKILWYPMNYYRDDELNYVYVINCIPITKARRILASFRSLTGAKSTAPA